jgi:hypothetical protein
MEDWTPKRIRRDQRNESPRDALAERAAIEAGAIVAQAAHRAQRRHSAHVIQNRTEAMGVVIYRTQRITRIYGTQRITP